MARKYVRDNRGRFATVGATARGGRLRTPKGNKRATVTMQGPKRANTVAKPRGLKPGAVAARRAAKPAAKPGKAPARAGSPATSILRPGELMNAVARPVNTMGRYRVDRGHGYKDAPKGALRGSPERKKAALANLAQARNDVQKGGGRFAGFVQRKADYAGFYTPSGRNISFNVSAPYWPSPVALGRYNRKEGHLAHASPRHAALHELGHAVNHRRRGFLSHEPAPKVAKRVSQYAQTNQAEFAAEVYAARKLGKKYDREVMTAYRQAMGLSERPPARRRSSLSRRPKAT